MDAKPSVCQLIFSVMTKIQSSLSLTEQTGEQNLWTEQTEKVLDSKFVHAINIYLINSIIIRWGFSFFVF